MKFFNKKQLNHYHQYHSYLKTISLLGKVYRNFFIFQKIKKNIDGLLLDNGCGLGDMLNIYKNSIGVDINPYNIEYCRSEGYNVYLLDEL